MQKNLYFLILTALTWTQAAPCFALTTLRNVEVDAQGLVKLQFDQKVGRGQMQVEYLKEVIQLSFGNTSVYPPKIIPVKSQFITKVFAYQYSPKWIRVRLFVKGDPAQYQDTLDIKTLGKTMQVSLEQPQATRKKGTLEGQGNENGIGSEDLEERELLSKVIQGGNLPVPSLALAPGAGTTKAVHAPEKAQETVKKSHSVAKHTAAEGEEDSEPLLGRKDQAEAGQLTGAKPLPSFGSVFLKLGLVTLIMVLLAFAVKRIKGNQKQSGILGAISAFTGKAFAQKPGKLFDVVSVHHLDPKKSIAAVRVGGKLLILGLSNDSINLITQFGDDTDGAMASFLGLGSDLGGSSLAGKSGVENAFGEFLQSESHKPSAMDRPFSSSDMSERFMGTSLAGRSSAHAQAQSNGQSSLVPSVRSRIKNRLEGLKPL